MATSKSAWKKLTTNAKAKWKAAQKKKKEQGSGFTNENVESGKYIAKLTKIEAAADGKSVFEHFKITEGESKNEVVKNRQGLDERGLSYFMTNLEKLGYEVPEDAEEMVETLPEILDEINETMPAVKITVKNSEKDGTDYQNVYIDRLLSDDEEADSTEELDDTASEDEEVELSIGMEVVATVDGEEIEGKIVKILESKGKVKIKDEEGETHLVDSDEISLPEDDEEEEEDDADDADESEDSDDSSEEDEEEDDEDSDEEEDSEDDDEEEDEDDDEEEEEEVKPKKKRPTRSSAKKKTTKKKAVKKAPAKKKTAKGRVTKKKGSLRKRR